MTEAHYEIECTTLPGAGAALEWSVVVNGEHSRAPQASYLPPEIYAVMKPYEGLTVDGMAAPGIDPGTSRDTRESDADTAGGTWLLVEGSNFGPPTSQAYDPEASSGAMVQWVEYGKPSSDDWKSVLDFRVLSHSRILVQLGSGIGKQFQIRLSVADQVS